MERRVFGCTEFSDVVFKNCLSMVEKIFDYILEDQDILPTNAKVSSDGMTATGTFTSKDG